MDKYLGEFEYLGETIYFNITDKTNEGIRVVNGIEKMSRYITFFNNKDENLGTRAIYGTFDEMTNITTFDARQWYIEMISK